MKVNACGGSKRGLLTEQSLRSFEGAPERLRVPFGQLWRIVLVGAIKRTVLAAYRRTESCGREREVTKSQKFFKNIPAVSGIFI